MFSETEKKKKKHTRSILKALSFNASRNLFICLNITILMIQLRRNKHFFIHKIEFYFLLKLSHSIDIVKLIRIIKSSVLSWHLHIIYVTASLGLRIGIYHIVILESTEYPSEIINYAVLISIKPMSLWM